MARVSAGNVSAAAAADCKGAVHQERQLSLNGSGWINWMAQVQRQRSKQTFSHQTASLMTRGRVEKFTFVLNKVCPFLTTSQWVTE